MQTHHRHSKWTIAFITPIIAGCAGEVASGNRPSSDWSAPATAGRGAATLVAHAAPASHEHPSNGAFDMSSDELDAIDPGRDLFEDDELGSGGAVELVSFVDLDEIPADARRELEGDALVDKALIGADGRMPVTNTRLAPYSAVVRLFIRFAKAGASYMCTGTLITSDAVLTAAHCVFDGTLSPDGYAYSVLAVPGLYPAAQTAGDTSYFAPFGSAYGKKIFVPARYRATESNAWNRIPHDYAIVRLKSQLGAAGVRSLGVLESAANKPTHLIGYHGDLRGGLAMHASQDQVRKVLSNGTFNHYTDMMPGASGAGITSTGNFSNTVFGINSSEVNGRNSYNIAAAIDVANHRVLLDWAAR
jgi:V8-like Glu-specific endopeptidase